MRSSKAEIYLHFVWATHNRALAITPLIERELYRCVQSGARQAGCRVLALGGMADHVHLVAKCHPKWAPSMIMHQVKGNSSHFARNLLPGNEGFRWQEGYGVFSIGPTDLQRVILYVRRQKTHHENGQIWSAWEETFVEVA